MNNFIIRRAVLEDMDDIMRIKKEVHDIYVDSRPDIYRNSETLYTENLLKSFFENVDKVIFLGLLDDEIVAFSFLECMNVSMPMMVKRKFAYVHDLAVLERFRRQGIASRLMDYVEKYAIERGATMIELAVHLFSEDAIKMYDKIGFSTRAMRMEKDLDIKQLDDPEKPEEDV